MFKLISKVDAIDLLICDRLRRMDDTAYGLKLFSRMCVLGHFVSVLGIASYLATGWNGSFGASPGAGDQSPLTMALHMVLTILVCAVAMAMIASVFFNRPLMYLALRNLADTEAAVFHSRNRQLRGATGTFLDWVPLSIFMPPGDLLAIPLYLQLIHANTDHLDLRSIDRMHAAELKLAFGATVQYVAFLALICSCLFFGMSLFVQAAIGIAWHLVTMIGVICVLQGTDAIRETLATSVHEARRGDLPSQKPQPESSAAREFA